MRTETFSFTEDNALSQLPEIIQNRNRKLETHATFTSRITCALTHSFRIQIDHFHFHGIQCKSLVIDLLSFHEKKNHLITKSRENEAGEAV